jgi:NADPH:quinone reductase
VTERADQSGLRTGGAMPPQLPPSMRAAVVDAYGPPGSVRLGEVARPAPGPQDVLVRVQAAAVNFPDLLLASGQYQVKQALPFVLGSDLAGEVIAAGSAVTDVRPGDRVRGAVATGAFAEYACLPRPSVRPVPDAVAAGEAAAFGVVYETAFHALTSVARLEPAERLCVLGAAGGVGLAAVDLGVLRGADVVAVATGPAKVGLCRARGAWDTVDLETEGLRERLREIGGVDVVVDMVGGDVSEPAIRSMRPGGRFVTVGYASGVIPRIQLNLVLLKGVSLLGFEMRTFAQRFPDQAERGWRELAGHLGRGRLRPHISARYPLAETAQALRAVAGRRALGKIVIDIGTEERTAWPRQ